MSTDTGDGRHIPKSLLTTPGGLVQFGANHTLVQVTPGTAGQIPTYQADGTLAPAAASGGGGGAIPTLIGGTSSFTIAANFVASFAPDPFIATTSHDNSLATNLHSGSTTGLTITAAGIYLLTVLFSVTGGSADATLTLDSGASVSHLIKAGTSQRVAYSVVLVAAAAQEVPFTAYNDHATATATCDYISFTLTRLGDVVA